MMKEKILTILAICVFAAADLMWQESAPYFCNVAGQFWNIRERRQRAM